VLGWCCGNDDGIGKGRGRYIMFWEDEKRRDRLYAG
jgi:hypothetical protein